MLVSGDIKDSHLLTYGGNNEPPNNRCTVYKPTHESYTTYILIASKLLCY